jgi:transposase-like protein
VVKALGMTGISKRQAGRLYGEIDDQAKAFLARPLEGDRPHPWLDATCVKLPQQSPIVSVAVIVAVGVNTDGRPEMLGLKIGASVAEAFLAGIRCASSHAAACAASSRDLRRA